MKPARLLRADGVFHEIDLDAEFLKMSLRGDGEEQPIPIVRIDLGTPFLDKDGKRIFENDMIEGYPAGPVKMGDKTGQWEAPYTTDGTKQPVYGAIPGGIVRPTNEEIENGAPVQPKPPFKLDIKVAGVNKD